MALLNVTVRTASSVSAGTKVVAELSDARGVPVPGYTATGAVFVEPTVATTDASGLVALDLTPNADITPAGTFYTIRIGAAQFLITKSASAQTLPEALV